MRCLKLSKYGIPESKNDTQKSICTHYHECIYRSNAKVFNIFHEISCTSLFPYEGTKSKFDLAVKRSRSTQDRYINSLSETGVPDAKYQVLRS